MEDPLTATIVYDGERPAIALAVYGTGLHPADVQILTRMIDFGLNPEEAVLAPRLGYFFFDPMKMTGDHTRNLLDLRIDPALVCQLGALGETLFQHETPGYPPGHLDLGFPTVVQIREGEILGMTPEWMDGVAAGD